MGSEVKSNAQKMSAGLEGKRENRRAILWCVIGFLAGVSVYWDLLHGVSVACAGAILYTGIRRESNWCLLGIVLGLLHEGIGVDDSAALSVIGLMWLLKTSGLWWVKNFKEMLLLCVGGILVADGIFYGQAFGEISWSAIAANGCLVALMLLLAVGSLESMERWEKDQECSMEAGGVVLATAGMVLLGCFSVQVGGAGVYAIAVQCALLFIGYGYGCGMATVCGVICGTVPAIILSGDMVWAGIYGMMGILCGLGKECNKYHAIAWLFLGNMISMAILNEFGRWLWWLVAWGTATGIFALCVEEKVRKRTESSFLPPSSMMQKERAFQMLADSLTGTKFRRDRNEDLERIFLQVYSQVCADCKEKEICWKRTEPDIRREIAEICDALEQGESVKSKGNVCRHQEGILIAIKGQLMLLRQKENYENQWFLTKKALAENITRLKSMVKETVSEKEKLAEGLYEYFLQKGVKVHFVSVERKEGRWEVVVSLNECPGEDCGNKIVNLAQEYTHREWRVEKEECNWMDEPYCRIKIKSKGDIYVKVDIHQRSADGEVMCGDVGEWWRIDECREAIVLCDGMGKGRKAYSESRKVVDLLKVLLPLLEVREALKFINNWLMMDSDGGFVGMDLLVVNKLKQEWELYKLNGARSYWKREDKIQVLEGASLPLGVLNEVQIYIRKQKIKKEDRLILTSDGVGLNDESAVETMLQKECDFMEELLNIGEDADDKTAIEIVFKEMTDGIDCLAGKEAS